MDVLSIQVIADHQEAKRKGEKLIKASDDAWARKIAIAKSAAVEQPQEQEADVFTVRRQPMFDADQLARILQNQSAQT